MWRLTPDGDRLCTTPHLRFLSVLRATLGAVDVTTREVEAIPRENLKVPRGEFVAVWREAERLCDERKGGRPGGGWYAAGVAITCRWIATASVVFNYPHGPRSQPAFAPITQRTARAHEELIEAECLAAEREAIRHPNGIESEPGWLEAVVATLNWVWRGSGVPPLEVRPAAAG